MSASLPERTTACPTTDAGISAESDEHSLAIGPHDQALLRPVEPVRHPAWLEHRAGHNYHRIVCRRCGRTEDAECRPGSRSCLEPADEHGFAIDGAEVIFRGLCPACAAAGMSSGDLGRMSPQFGVHLGITPS
jgi:hypothetical protein